ncbi:NF-kappa-B inhibitor cactus [Temnothorax nylanderi]|uniref:NF-kappa-B inhibitor cactus n=1 Tax=Temnothorax nylanderi TaxID=102681 RepID=UPI003A858477
MWYSPSESVQMEDDGKGRRNDDEFPTDNVDSGFLSAGNMQISGEIRESGTPQPQPRTNENRQAEPAASGATTSASSSSSSSPSATVAGAGEPTRIVESSIVDVDLSEGLNQLTLKQQQQQPGVNSLAVDSGDLARPEPTTIFELTPVRTGPQHQGDLLLEQHQRENVKKRAMNENAWQQLYYGQDEDGDTQLHIAIIRGYMEAALILIRLAPHPCFLDTYNDDTQSPLHLAVLTNQSLIVRRLILAGADPSLRNFRGNTALHLACMSGDLACAKALTDPLSPMERNRLMPGQTVPALPQDLEKRNYNGEMCLHLAAGNGHVNLVRLLLRLGADLEAREGLAGKTALHLAMERGCQLVINFLLQECKPCLDTQMYSGLTAYQLALCTDGQLAKELVRRGAQPEPLPESDSENSSEDEAYGEASYLPAIVKMQNAVEVNV